MSGLHYIGECFLVSKWQMLSCLDDVTREEDAEAVAPWRLASARRQRQLLLQSGNRSPQEQTKHTHYYPQALQNRLKTIQILTKKKQGNILIWQVTYISP